jgi:hypothetical protein
MLKPSLAGNKLTQSEIKVSEKTEQNQPAGLFSDPDRPVRPVLVPLPEPPGPLPDPYPEDYPDLFDDDEEEPLINGMESGDSFPFLSLGNTSFVLDGDKHAGHMHRVGEGPSSLSKRVESGDFLSVPFSGFHGPFLPTETPSRHIKTNCDDGDKSCDFAVARFKEYLKKREDWYIRIHGKVNLTQTEFTFSKTDVHRWKDGYLKKRLARLYKLRDWFEGQPSQDVSMVTLTVPHNENIWGVKVRSGANHFQAWNNLKQGWNRLRQCAVFRGRDFACFFEPHKTGYPHLHLSVFGVPFTDEEINHIKALWAEMTGADLLNGVEIRPGIGVKHLIAYLMKYMSKTFYHTIDSWTEGEWLFNAIAHEERYRLFGSSNALAEVMRLTTDSSGDVECLDVSLGGLKPRMEDDQVNTSRIWGNPAYKQNHPILREYIPIPTSERVAAWKLKKGIVNSPAELAFKVRYKAWEKWRKKHPDLIPNHGGRNAERQLEYEKACGVSGGKKLSVADPYEEFNKNYALTCERARLDRLAMGIT